MNSKGSAEESGSRATANLWDRSCLTISPKIPHDVVRRLNKTTHPFVAITSINSSLDYGRAQAATPPARLVSFKNVLEVSNVSFRGVDVQLDRSGKLLGISVVSRNSDVFFERGVKVAKPWLILT